MTRKLIIWSGAKTSIQYKYVAPTVKAAKVPHYVTYYKEPVEWNDGSINYHIPDVPKGSVCLAMGSKCVESLKAAGLTPKNLGIGKLRETIWAAPQGGSFLVSYDPAIIEMDYARKPEVEWDINLGVRLLKTGQLEPQLGKYGYVDNFAFLIKYCMKQYAKTGKPVKLSCDTETVGLDPLGADVHLVSVGFSAKKGYGHVLYFGNAGDYPKKGTKLWNQLEWLLTNPAVKIRGANFKFDWHWLYRHLDIACTNWSFDTLLAGSLLDENRINSLNMHTKIFVPELGGYDDSFNKTYDKSKMHEVPKDKMLPYAAGDLDADLRVSQKLERMLLRDKKLTRFYAHILHPSAQAFAVIEYRGMHVDVEKYEVLRKDVQKEIEENHKIALDLIPAQIQNKYVDNLSLTRDVILQEYLFSPRGLNLKPKMMTPKGNKPSTSKAHLQMFLDHPEAGTFLKALFEWKSAKKTMTTYIVGFLKHLRTDGRFHPTYMLHRGDYDGDAGGTVTGRSSAKDPAYQTIPKHTKWAKRLREVYVAPPGHVVLNADFSQGELRIAACIANEPTMIAAYRKGIDLHLLTGLALWNIQNPNKKYTLAQATKLKLAGDETIKMVRQGGKAGNFGLLYGMQPAGFKAYAYLTYGVTLTMEQAEAFRDAFFQRYPRLTDWHEDSAKTAHRYGQVRSPLGRIRHLPLIHSKDWQIKSQAERQAINAPVQSTLSDLGQLAAAELHRLYPELWCFGFTHDALSFYIPEGEVQLWAKRIKKVMENLPLKKVRWSPQLDFPVDIEVGPDLGHMTELDMAA